MLAFYKNVDGSWTAYYRFGDIDIPQSTYATFQTLTEAEEWLDLISRANEPWLYTSNT
jgi:hypothetical protein